MSEARPSRVSDIREFVADVLRTVAGRPRFDGPSGAVSWLGDVAGVVRGDDPAAKRGLACKLIAVGLPDATGGDALAELVTQACVQVIGEMNELVAGLEGALVSLAERPVSPDELAASGQTMQDVLEEGDERVVQATALFLAGAVLADPRSPPLAGETVGRVAGGIAEAFAYARGLPLPAGTPGQHLEGIVLCAEKIVDPDRLALVPDGDTVVHHSWGRIAGHAARLIEWEAFSEPEPPAPEQLERAVEEAVAALAGSAVLAAPVCFEHAHAAAAVGTEARAIAIRWLDRALGYFDDGEIRTGQDVGTLRGMLAQALIGIFCSTA